MLDELPDGEVDVLAEYFAIGRPNPKRENLSVGNAGRRVACAAALREWVEKELTMEYQMAKERADQLHADETKARARRRMLRLEAAL